MGCCRSKPYRRYWPEALSLGKLDEKDEKEKDADQTTLVMVIGEMGSGKSFTALRLARALGWQFYEGDDARAWYTRLFGFLRKEDTGIFNRYVAVEYFLRAYLVPAILLRLVAHRTLVVSQALYFADHRKMIADYFTKKGVKVIYVYVKTDTEQQNKQLLSRRFGKFWKWYAQKNKPFFQPPSKPINAHNNNNNKNDMKQTDTKSDTKVDKSDEPIHFLFDNAITDHVEHDKRIQQLKQNITEICFPPLPTPLPIPPTHS